MKRKFDFSRIKKKNRYGKDKYKSPVVEGYNVSRNFPQVEDPPKVHDAGKHINVLAVR
jgi:hypothetical protein